VSLYLILIPTACYLLEGILSFRRGDMAGFMVFVSYGTANLGLLWKFHYA